MRGVAGRNLGEVVVETGTPAPCLPPDEPVKATWRPARSPTSQKVTSSRTPME
jgi:hypothetical protein